MKGKKSHEMRLISEKEVGINKKGEEERLVVDGININ